MRQVVLVTGAAGYLGHRVCAHLVRRGAEVAAVDLYPRGEETLAKVLGGLGSTLQCDIRNEGQLSRIFQEFRPTACIHLAAVVGEKLCNVFPEEAKSINCDAAGLLANIAKESGCQRLIFASTCSVYGITVRLVDESHQVRPLSVYGETKAEAERILSYRARPEFHTIIFRLSTLYGVSERMRFDLTVNEFAAAAHFEGHLRLYSAETRRPYLHVDDAARAFASFALDSNSRSGIYNLGGRNQTLSKRMLARLVATEWPGVRVDDVGQGDDRRDYTVIFDKIEQFGFRPELNVQIGLKELHSYLSSASRPFDYRSNEFGASIYCG